MVGQSLAEFDSPVENQDAPEALEDGSQAPDIFIIVMSKVKVIANVNTSVNIKINFESWP